MTAKRFIKLLAWALLCGVALGAGVRLGHNPMAMDLFWGTIVHPTPPENTFSQDTLTVLALGVDANYGSYHGKPSFTNSRSDTMMVARFDFKNKRAFIISIPRDTYVEIPGHGRRQKVNAANALGGADLAKQTVENMLGVQIDKVITLNFLGFEKIIDDVGGVYVDVDKNMNYDDNAGKLHIHLKKGPQWLNGYQAMGFVRFRHSDSDFYRAKRHQRFLLALQQQIKQQSLTKLFDVAQTVDQNVSGLDGKEMASLLQWAQRLGPGAVKGVTLPTKFIGSQDFAPDYREIERVLELAQWPRAASAGANSTF